MMAASVPSTSISLPACVMYSFDHLAVFLILMVIVPTGFPFSITVQIPSDVPCAACFCSNLYCEKTLWKSCMLISSAMSPFLGTNVVWISSTPCLSFFTISITGSISSRIASLLARSRPDSSVRLCIIFTASTFSLAVPSLIQPEIALIVSRLRPFNPNLSNSIGVPHIGHGTKSGSSSFIFGNDFTKSLDQKNFQVQFRCKFVAS